MPYHHTPNWLPASPRGRCRGRPCSRVIAIVSWVRSASRTSASHALSRWKPNGRPLPSVTSLHLVPFPFLVSATRSLPPVGRHERTIQECHGPVELALRVKHSERGPLDTFPHAFLVPAPESSPHRRRCTVLPWQVLPAAASDKRIQDALTSSAAICARATHCVLGAGAANGQGSIACQRDESCPCRHASSSRERFKTASNACFLVCLADWWVTGALHLGISAALSSCMIAGPHYTWGHSTSHSASP
jgi:hypothetical protein